MSAIHSSQLIFFSAFAPFNRMEPVHLHWMLEHMRLSYYSEGDVIVSPEQNQVEQFYVIKQGLVHGEQSVAKIAEEDTWLELIEGECFPLGALLANRPVASVYRAGKDTFCFELATNDFHTLLDTSEPFRDFCTRRIANLLEHSKKVIQAQYTHSGIEQQPLTVNACEATRINGGSGCRRAPTWYLDTTRCASTDCLAQGQFGSARY